MARPNTPRGGRPRTRGGQLLDHKVTIYLSASEIVRVERAAEAASLPLGAWIALRALEHAPSVLEDREAVEAALER